MANSSITSLLLRAKSDEIEMLESSLVKEKLCKRSANLSYWCHKKARHHRAFDVHDTHWAVQEDKGADSDNVCAISYLNDETKRDIQELPTFSSTTNWTKNLAGVLVEFSFMNLLVYLVYGRDKTFDMQSMKAFRSLKAYT